MKNASFIYVLLALFLSWVSISCIYKENRGDDTLSIGINRIANLGAFRREGARPDFKDSLLADNVIYPSLGAQFISGRYYQAQ